MTQTQRQQQEHKKPVQYTPQRLFAFWKDLVLIQPCIHSREGLHIHPSFWFSREQLNPPKRGEQHPSIGATEQQRGELQKQCLCKNDFTYTIVTQYRLVSHLVKRGSFAIQGHSFLQQTTGDIFLLSFLFARVGEKGKISFSNQRTVSVSLE